MTFSFEKSPTTWGIAFGFLVEPSPRSVTFGFGLWKWTWVWEWSK